MWQKIFVKLLFITVICIPKVTIIFNANANEANHKILI